MLSKFLLTVDSNDPRTAALLDQRIAPTRAVRAARSEAPFSSGGVSPPVRRRSFPFLGPWLGRHSGHQQLSGTRITVGPHRYAQHPCPLFLHVIAAAALYLEYCKGVSFNDLLSQSQQYLPLSECFVSECSQDDSTGISAASVQHRRITEQYPTLFERVTSASQQIFRCDRFSHLEI
jgi:hypothetical protein